MGTKLYCTRDGDREEVSARACISLILIFYPSEESPHESCRLETVTWATAGNWLPRSGFCPCMHGSSCSVAEKGCVCWVCTHWVWRVGFVHTGFVSAYQILHSAGKQVKEITVAFVAFISDKSWKRCGYCLKTGGSLKGRKRNPLSVLHF